MSPWHAVATASTMALATAFLASFRVPLLPVATALTALSMPEKSDRQQQQQMISASGKPLLSPATAGRGSSATPLSYYATGPLNQLVSEQILLSSPAGGVAVSPMVFSPSGEAGRLDNSRRVANRVDFIILTTAAAASASGGQQGPGQPSWLRLGQLQRRLTG